MRELRGSVWIVEEYEVVDKAVVPAEAHPPEVTSMEPMHYTLEVEVARATAKQAMHEARNLCDFPAQWPPYCVTRPTHTVAASKTEAT
jgi:hypothetical protein